MGFTSRLLERYGSVVETFVPSKTASSSLTTVFPTNAPIPHNGTAASMTTGSTAVSNPGAELGTLASGLYAQALNYTNAALAVPDTDEQSWRAAQGTVSLLVASMNCMLKRPWEAPPTPGPAPTWPAYDRTSYPSPNPDSSPAPFCGEPPPTATAPPPPPSHSPREG
jgi:hypothetical protein